MEKAFTLPGTDAAQIYGCGVRQLRSGKQEKAMKIFVRNQQKHPDKFWTSPGFARAYTALGHKPKAIANSGNRFTQRSSQPERPNRQLELAKRRQSDGHDSS